MDQRALEHHLRQSEFSIVQAATLSHILAEQATKDDLRVLGAALRGEMAELRGEMRALRAELHGELSASQAELHGELSAFRAELHGELSAFREDVQGALGASRVEVQGNIRSLRSEMIALNERLESRLTWRFVAAAAFMGTVMALVGALTG